MASELSTGRMTAMLVLVTVIGMGGSALGSGAMIYFGLKQQVSQNASSIQFNDYKIHQETIQRQKNYQQIMTQLDRIEHDYYGPRIGPTEKK